jgi:hypothetical protein
MCVVGCMYDSHCSLEVASACVLLLLLTVDANVLLSHQAVKLSDIPSIFNILRTPY